MAHHIKITSKPHKNKDGAKSKARMDHIVTHRHRGKKTIVGTFTSRKAAEEALESERYKTFELKAGS